MTTFSFIVGIGLFWFCCFLYVVQGLHRGEKHPWPLGEARDDGMTPPLLTGARFARTRVKRG